MKRSAILAALAVAGTIVTASPALAGTGPHYWANDVAGTGKFGTPITGTASEIIVTAAGRWKADAAEFATTAADHHFALPGGIEWLLGHPAAWHDEVTAFEGYLFRHLVEDARWCSSYWTEAAVPHGTAPTTFVTVHIGGSPCRTVLVFSDGHDDTPNCGFQPYRSDRAIPLPARPRQVKGCGGFESCAPCPAGQHLAGQVCKPPCAIHVYVVTTVQSGGATVVTVVTITVEGGTVIVDVAVTITGAGCPCQCPC